MKKSIDNVYVFGVGAAGSNVLINLIYSLPEVNFTAIDFDKVEMRNITAGTQPYSKSDLNRPKTQAIQKIVKMNSGVNISGINKKINSIEDIKGIVSDFSNSLIIDAFDNACSRNLFHKIDNSSNVLHIGFSADLSGEATWDESYEVMQESEKDKEIDVCQMAIARPFICGLSAIATLNIVNFIHTGEKRSSYFDKDLNIMKWN